MSQKEIVTYYVFLLLLAAGLFSLSNLTTFIAGTVCNAVLFLYSWKMRTWKGWWLSNVIVALLIATMLSFGIFVAQEISFQAPILFFFWFLISLARDILGDVTDMEGDRAAQLRTLPLVAGRKQAITAAVIILFIAALWSYTPLMLELFSYWWYGLAISTVYVFSFRYAIHRLREEESVRPIQDVLKGALVLHPMLFGLAVWITG